MILFIDAIQEMKYLSEELNQALELYKYLKINSECIANFKYDISSKIYSNSKSIKTIKYLVSVDPY